MAAEAICCQFEVGRRLNLVTGFTHKIAVRACQWIARLLVVIKTPARPAVRIVTAATSRTKSTLMPVMVTLFAGKRRVLIGRGSMALLAGDRDMKADQGHPRQIMVEGEFLAPVIFIMTPIAALSQFTLMRILLAVT